MGPPGFGSHDPPAEAEAQVINARFRPPVGWNRPAGYHECDLEMDARGITGPELADGYQRSTLEALAEWTLWADNVLVF